MLRADACPPGEWRCLCYYRFHLCCYVTAASDRDSCSTLKCSTNTPRCSNNSLSVCSNAAMAMPALAACVSENAQRDRKANTRPGRFHELSKSQDYPARPRFRVRVGSRPWPVDCRRSTFSACVAERGSSAGRKLFDAVLPHAPQKGCLGPLVVTRAAQLTDSTSALRTPAPSVDVVGVRG